jgi:hypothetical protein
MIKLGGVEKNSTKFVEKCRVFSNKIRKNARRKYAFLCGLAEITTMRL